MASHGTDQLIVQRLLATKSLTAGRKALIGSGIIVILQMALFMIVGLMLYGYYHGASVSSLGLQRADEVFPRYIIEGLPTGIAGFVIAGLTAVALSTLGGSISSMASSMVLDLYKPRATKQLTPEKEVLYSRFATILWAVLLVLSAFFFMNTTQTVVELALSIASFTYGGLLGTFLLGLLFKRPKPGRRPCRICRRHPCDGYGDLTPYGRVDMVHTYRGDCHAGDWRRTGGAGEENGRQ